jgi:hypothetical protein
LAWTPNYKNYKMTLLMQAMWKMRRLRLSLALPLPLRS